MGSMLCPPKILSHGSKPLSTSSPLAGLFALSVDDLLQGVRKYVEHATYVPSVRAALSRLCSREPRGIEKVVDGEMMGCQCTSQVS
jgi:hypothetical protein